ncbi:hypothetical protein BDV93DRAFT_527673 [Ceratobasidium sp. AG-I]|nr:hypothetical protein BDV93DRAFT_527673 [Ceratobasidium sp. AG-I]
MQAIPLPNFDDLRATFACTEGAQAAYERIYNLDAEERISTKILGWMLIHAPSPEGRAYLANSIGRCEDEGKILELGKFHLDHFVNYFKSKRATRPPSPYPSESSIEKLRQDISNSLVAAPTSHQGAKMQALIRDNYRCQLSGATDSTYYCSNPDLEEADDHTAVCETECAHILPSYVNTGIQTDTEKRAFASDVRVIAQSFGGISARELSEVGMHSLNNVMTLDVGLGRLFDRLAIWLEPIEGKVNEYTIGKVSPLMAVNAPATVKFTNAFTDILPSPDPRYLALHAACAKVVLKSGAAKHIYAILNELEYTEVLSADGSSAQLLDSLLSGASLLVR